MDHNLELVRILNENGKTSLKQRAKVAWTHLAEDLICHIITVFTTLTTKLCHSSARLVWIKVVQQAFRTNSQLHITTNQLLCLTVVINTLWCREDQQYLPTQTVGTTITQRTTTWTIVSSTKLKLRHLVCRVMVVSQERVGAQKLAVNLVIFLDTISNDKDQA